MTMIYGRRLIVSVLLLLYACISLSAQSTAFSYQGRLTDNSAPPSGTYQMQFALFDGATGGAQVGPTVDNTAVSVQNGIFSVQLDFGSSPFSNGEDRYLEVRVRRNSGESYVALNPRTQIGRVPYANQAFSGDEERAKLLGAGRWDLLRAITTYQRSFARALHFDGANLWVSITNNGTVIKMRPSDGQVLGTYTVGSDPRGMASDGTNLWVANFGSGTVTRLRISDGASQGTFAVGTNPVAVCFDGVNVWVANNGSSSVTRLRASDGQLLNTYAGAANPTAVLSDGSSVYIVTPTGTTRRRVSDGGSMGSFPMASLAVYDGYNFWSPYGNSFDISRVRADGFIPETIQVSTVASSPTLLQFDGRSIWVGFSNGPTVSRFYPAAHRNSATWASVTLPNNPFGGNNAPSASAFDGKNVWFIQGTVDSTYLTKLPAYP
jgi:hypothetical protein